MYSKVPLLIAEQSQFLPILRLTLGFAPFAPNYKMADTEIDVHKAKEWLLSTVLSLAATVASCFIPSRLAALKSAAIIVSTVSTTVCGCKTNSRWPDMKNSDQDTKTQVTIENVVHANDDC
jgi:hypothetical protein